MIIRRIEKSNKNSDKVYTYYRPVHTYKVEKKVRQQNLLNLGKLEGVSKEEYKSLANRTEEIGTGKISMFSDVPEYWEKQAQHFANQIIAKDIFPIKKEKKETCV